MIVLSGVLLLSVLLRAIQAAAPSTIAADGTLGTTITQTGRDYSIQGGTLQGNNLFHSFSQFSVGMGDAAIFVDPSNGATITNVLSRVTGGQLSSIDGRLVSEIAGANLFLLNPSGVMFGPHASLDVKGSFHVTTADFLRFADGTKFSAHLGQESALTVASPAAFGFLGGHPAAMTIQGSSLTVPEGKALSVVGGDVTILGNNGPLTDDSVRTLSAPSGRIQLASLASPGEVLFSSSDLASGLEVDSVARLGRLALSQNAFLDASGNGGGSVLLRSDRLWVDGGWIRADNHGHVDGTGLGLDLSIRADAIIRNDSSLTTDSVGAGRARDLRLTAGHLHSDASIIASRAFPGDGGNIVISGGNVTLTAGAQINASSFGPGRAGDMTVMATNLLSIAGKSEAGDQSGLFSAALGGGDGGRLYIETSTLRMDDGRIATSTLGDGNAGSIEVLVDRLILSGGARLVTGTGTILNGVPRGIEGHGRGGELGVTAREAITITGRSSEGFSSGLFSNARYGQGNAGKLSISTPVLTMDGGGIEAETASPSRGDAGNIQLAVGRLTLTGSAQISTSSFGPGRAGTVSIAATESISITGSGLFSFTQQSGAGGNLGIVAPSLQLSDGATISARSSGQGDAGNIGIQAGDTFHSRHSALVTATEGAGGGSIALHTGQLVRLQESEVTTSVRGGGGDAGNLIIESPFAIAEGSRIVANAFEGMGGRIDINGDVFLADPGSLVNASSTLGIQGTVNIQAPVTSLSGTVAPLPQAFVNVATLLPARCAARLRGGRASSLVLGGRDGLPLEPGGLLPGPLEFENRLVADPTITEALWQLHATRGTPLGGVAKRFPRMPKADLSVVSQAAWNWECPQ